MSRQPRGSKLAIVVVLGALAGSACAGSGATQAPPASAADCPPVSSASEAARCEQRRRMTAERMKSEMRGEQRLRAEERRHEAFIDRNGGSSHP